MGSPAYPLTQLQPAQAASNIWQQKWYSEEDDVVRRVKSGEGVQHFETVRVRKGGSRIDVAITASAIYEDGVVVGVSKIARDMSDRKKAERDGARLAAIVESSDDAIVTKDLNGIVSVLEPGG